MEDKIFVCLVGDLAMQTDGEKLAIIYISSKRKGKDTQNAE